MTLRALQIRMRLVPKRTRRDSITRGIQRPPVFRLARSRLLGEIGSALFERRPLVTHIAILRQGRELALLIVTSEATRVCERPRPKSSLVIAFVDLMTVGTLRIGVFVVREQNAKLRNKIDRPCSREKRFTQTRKRIARCLDRRCFHVTVGTDLRNRTLTREELLPMAIQTRRVFGKLGHIGKRSIAFANFLPVPRGKLVTRGAREFLFSDVSGMRKARVIDRR